MILDSAMASKMKNIDHKKTLLFKTEDGFHPKKLHGLSEEPNPLSHQATSATISLMSQEKHCCIDSSAVTMAQWHNGAQRTVI